MDWMPPSMSAPIVSNVLAWYGPADADKVRRTLQFKPKFEEEKILLYREADGWVGIPRGLVDHLTPESEERTRGAATKFQMRNPPRSSEQARVIEESSTLLRIEGRSHIVQAPTGFGKTYCALSVIQRVGRVTMVIVTKEDLMQQWREAILKHTTLTDDDIGTVQQEVCDIDGKAIIIGMVHTVSKDRIPRHLIDSIGMVVWDEVHRLGADTFSETAAMFHARYRLGLSATPTRIDGKDPIFLSHIGPIMVTTQHMVVKPRVLVDTIPFRVRLPHWYVPDPGKLAPVTKGLAADNDRNTRLAMFVLRAYNKGRKTIIFSDLKDAHLKVLRELTATMGVPQEAMAYYVGGMTEKAREEAKLKPVIWATYAMTSEATDIPWLDTAVLATPRANVTQAIGRVLREWPDKKRPVVYDLVDQGFPILEALANKRLSVYRSLNSEIITL